MKLRLHLQQGEPACLPELESAHASPWRIAWDTLSTNHPCPLADLLRAVSPTVFPLYLSREQGKEETQQALSWAIGFLDEVWWSRFALPHASAWQDQEEPVRFVEQRWQKADPDAKALACYGMLWQRGPAEAPVRDQMLLHFVDGRPVSDITTQFLAWCCTELEAQGKRAWLPIWENASWHDSKIVRTWIRDHNQQVKASGKSDQFHVGIHTLSGSSTGGGY